VSRPTRIEFRGAEDNRLVADLWDGKGHPVVLFHGGGQTRRAWDATAKRLMMAGLRAITVDQRGHGESQWVESGDYRFASYAEDVGVIVRQVASRFHVAPSAVGASLGGIASIAAELRHGPMLDTLVLVDVIPRMDPEGVARIQGFMGARMEEGFANLDEAAAAIAAYLPNRKRAVSHEGLRKNLRLDADGRYRWHWDPGFITSERNINAGAVELMGEIMAGVPELHVPMLVVRGMESELVHEDYVREFVDMAPDATYVDVSGAGHMVAGDKNDAFCDAILGFLTDREAA
jgi:pimeloyl-ACP methyl ester carboxylesterase